MDDGIGKKIELLPDQLTVVVMDDGFGNNPHPTRFDPNSSKKRKLPINELEGLQLPCSKYKFRRNRSHSFHYHASDEDGDDVEDEDGDDVEDEEHTLPEPRSVDLSLIPGESSSDNMATEFPVELVEYEIHDDNYYVIESESVSKDGTHLEEEEEEHTSSTTTCDIKDVPRELTVDQEFEQYFSMLML